LDDDQQAAESTSVVMTMERICPKGHISTDPDCVAAKHR
jgi:hypothetical protein